MNIFATNPDPVQAAKEHCVVHQVKMTVELAQMLSTAHRIIDGTPMLLAPDPTTPDRRVTWYLVPSDVIKASCVHQHQLYAVAHEHHPCTTWVQQSSGNYKYAYNMFFALCQLYKSRTGKDHGSAFLIEYLNKAPRKIQLGPRTNHVLAMPEQYKKTNPYLAYQEYLNDKFKEWKDRNNPRLWPPVFPLGTPHWYIENKRGI